MLGVRWVLVGSVRHAGTAVRITAQLVDAERDHTVWSDRFGGSAEDVFDLQERLSREIVGALRVTLSPEDHVTLARTKVDPRVRECCARARRDLFLVSDHGLASARAIVEEGIRVLGEHSQLLAMLGMVNWQEVNSGKSSDERLVEEAERLARHALARDADCAEAYMLLGFIRVARGPTAEALLHLRRVCELDPANVDALGLLAVGLMLRGHEADATRAVERALAIDPLSPSSHAAAGYLYTFVGDRQASATAWASARRLAGASAAYAFFEACAVLAIGDRDRALGMLDEAATGTDGMATLARAMACAIRGEGEAAVQAMIAPLRSWIERDVSMAWPAAQIFAQAGEAEEAIRWLGVAVDLGLVHYALLAERDVLLAPVRGHPAFATLLDRVRADAPMAAVLQ
jgi:tetratricopeptide (TPR) repeat protein